jgi:hypothetical protein
MPWQHRLSRKELPTPPAAASAAGGAEAGAAVAGDGGSAAASSQEGSAHGSSLQAERSLRVPLDRLTSARTDSSARTIHSAR